MVTKEQFIHGVLTYIDNEVIPSLPSTGKWGLGTLVVLGTSKADRLFDEVSKNDFIKTLDVIDPGGMVDIDRLSSAVQKTAERYGKMSISIPIIGTLTFSVEDVEKLSHYIKGGIIDD